MSSIYQHFRPEEKDFIDQVMEWKHLAEDTYAPRLTDFLDPRQQMILQSIIGSQGEVQHMLFGGSGRCERKRALIYPSYFEPAGSDFQIGLFEIEYPKKFIHLDHRMVLGSLMSIGLKREKFGDIVLAGDRIQFFLADEVEEFVTLQLTQIGKAKVTVTKRKLHDAIQSEETWREIETTVSSLRLDAVLASVFKLSRQKAQGLIQHELVKVNWSTVEQLSFECGEGDVISARGFGRCKVLEVGGKTKKDRWRIMAGILK